MTTEVDPLSEKVEAEPEAPRPSTVRAFHPPLFAAYAVFSLLAHNRHEAHLAWALLPLAAALLFSGVLWGAFALALRSQAKGALPASLSLLLFFSFGHVVVPLVDRESAHWPGIVLQVIGAELVLLLAICLLVARMRKGMAALTRFANIAAVVLVALPLLSLAWFEIRKPRRAAPATVTATVELDEAPDIYLIIPDAHARADVMLDMYGHDLEPFLAELEGLGFVVARSSTANYSMTPVSIASMLNLRYLDLEGLAWGDLRDISASIRHSEFEAMLRGAGYKTIAFPTGAPYTEMRHFDQYYHGLGAAAGFYRLFVELTPVAVLLEDNPWWNEFISDRERLLFTLDHLPEIALDPEPTFTFVHLELPHPPFRFGENGEDVFAEYRDLTDDGAGWRSPELQARYPEAYRRQTIYTDRRIAEVVRKILEDSDSPPVILILSDHGPRLTYDWTGPERTDVREALGNLTAVYMPGAEEAIYPGITPVNVMRVVANEVLGADLPLLEDRAYLSSDAGGRHALEDVTERARPAQ